MCFMLLACQSTEEIIQAFDTNLNNTMVIDSKIKMNIPVANKL